MEWVVVALLLSVVVATGKFQRDGDRWRRSKGSSCGCVFGTVLCHCCGYLCYFCSYHCVDSKFLIGCRRCCHCHRCGDSKFRIGCHRCSHCCGDSKFLIGCCHWSCALHGMDPTLGVVRTIIFRWFWNSVLLGILFPLYWLYCSYLLMDLIARMTASWFQTWQIGFSIACCTRLQERRMSIFTHACWLLRDCAGL